MVKNSKENNRKTARTFGDPGMSSRALYRTQKAKYLNLPFWKKLLLPIVLIILGGVAAFLINQNILVGAGVGALISLGALLILLAPNALIIGGIVFAFFIISFPIVYSYTAAQKLGNVPTSTEIGWNLLTMLAAVTASTWLSIQYSRGRAWLTLALTAASTFTIGYVLLTFFPELGLYNALAGMALVLALRCGGWAWITGLANIGLSKMRKDSIKIKNSTEEKQILNAWMKQAEVEQKTSTILDSLNKDYTIFHDMTVSRKAPNIQHLIIGPSGVFIIAPVSIQGQITENKAEGVKIPGTDLSTISANLLYNKKLLTKKLKTSETNIQTCILVLPEGKIKLEENLRKTLAVFRETDGAIPSDYITIIGEEQLLKEIDNGFAIINKINQNMITQRAKMALMPAGVPTPARVSSEATIQIATVDVDGKVKKPGEANLYPWVKDGAAVNIQTNAGVLTNLRIVGNQYTGKNGRLLVNLCAQEEWQDSLVGDRKPVTYPYPVSALIQPV